MSDTALFKKRKTNASHLRRPTKRPFSNTSNSSDSDISDQDIHPILVKQRKPPSTPLISSQSKRTNTMKQAKLENDILDSITHGEKHVKVGMEGSLDKNKDNATRAYTLDDTNAPVTTKTTHDDVNINEYHGKQGYRQLYTPREQLDKKLNGRGPIRASAHLRVTCRFDYQPHVCKDYKETGYCGYGDSCIFLHDRGDYKQGWQLDQEWDEMQRKGLVKQTNSRELNPLDVDAPSSLHNTREIEEEALPFACLICRGEFKNPVVTPCGHYFCETCALKRYQRTTKCAGCSSSTQGIFNRATKLLKHLEKKKQREEMKEFGVVMDEDHASEEKLHEEHPVLRIVKNGNRTGFVPVSPHQE